MGTILTFPNAKARRDAVESAWNDYQSLAQAALDDPQLLIDREYSQTLVRSWDRWRDLYLAKGVGN